MRYEKQLLIKVETEIEIKIEAVNIWILNHSATPPDTPGSARHFDFAKPDGSITGAILPERVNQTGGWIS